MSLLLSNFNKKGVIACLAVERSFCLKDSYGFSSLEPTQKPAYDRFCKCTENQILHYACLPVQAGSA